MKYKWRKEILKERKSKIVKYFKSVTKNGEQFLKGNSLFVSTKPLVNGEKISVPEEGASFHIKKSDKVL